MKKLICILASAAIFGACEQKTEVVAPTSPVPEKKIDKAFDANTFNRSKKPTLTSETKSEPASTEASSPTP